MAVGKRHVRFLRMAKMAVGIVVRTGIIGLQIQVIPFLEFHFGLEKIVNGRGIGKQCGFRGPTEAVGVDGRLAGRHKNIPVAAVAEDGVGAFGLELRIAAGFSTGQSRTSLPCKYRNNAPADRSNARWPSCPAREPAKPPGFSGAIHFGPERKAFSLLSFQ